MEFYPDTEWLSGAIPEEVADRRDCGICLAPEGQRQRVLRAKASNEKEDGGIPDWAVEEICAIPKYVISDEQGE